MICELISQVLARARGAATLLFMYISLASCAENDAPWQEMRSPDELMYAVNIRTYDEGYADDPFDIRLRSKVSSVREATVFQSTQCKNVLLLPRQDYLYVFYEFIIVANYSSVQHHKSFPRVFFCDVSHQFCSDLLKDAIARKEPMSQACTYI